MVGAGGFEPPTPCAQGRCATRLRYAPTRSAFLILNDFGDGVFVKAEVFSSPDHLQDIVVPRRNSLQESPPFRPHAAVEEGLASIVQQ